MPVLSLLSQSQSFKSQIRVSYFSPSCAAYIILKPKNKYKYEQTKKLTLATTEENVGDRIWMCKTKDCSRPRHNSSKGSVTQSKMHIPQVILNHFRLYTGEYFYFKLCTVMMWMRNVPVGFMCLTLGPDGSTVLRTMEYIGGSSLAGGSTSLGNGFGSF